MNQENHKARKDVDKAKNQLDAAGENLKARKFADSVQASQNCIELAVKAILSLLEIEYEFSHGWDKKQLSKVTQQINEKRVLLSLKNEGFGGIRLPRLLFLMNFWASAYLPSKYGMEDGYLASAQDLFEEGEARLASQHAEECYQAALQLANANECKLLNVVTQGQLREKDYPHLGYLIAWNDKRVSRERPLDAEEIEGKTLVETKSGYASENAIAFWTEEGCYGTIQMHKGLRGTAPRTWPIDHFKGRWWAKKLTVKTFRIVESRDGV